MILKFCVLKPFRKVSGRLRNEPRNPEPNLYSTLITFVSNYVGRFCPLIKKQYFTRLDLNEVIKRHAFAKPSSDSCDCFFCIYSAFFCSSFLSLVWYTCALGKCWRGIGSYLGTTSFKTDIQTRWC